MIFFCFGAGFALGAALAFFMQAVKIARLGERLHGYEALISNERVTKEKLQNEFRLAASQELQNTAEQFLTTALKDLRQVKTEANDTMDKKEREITHSVSEMKSKLEDYQKIVKKFEEERFAMYARVEQSLDQVLNAEQLIRMETSALKRVLTTSAGVRGSWGQKVLQEILEQSGLVRGQNFETQVTLPGQEGNDIRPDFVIHLPDGKRLIVDSKETGGEYHLAQQTEDPEKQKEHTDRLVANIRSHVVRLSRKEYQSFLDPDIPFVVMFIPNEPAIRAAFSADPDIFQDATDKRVILASPMTIIPLVFLIANGWQQHRLAENARDLGSTVEVLGDRIRNFVEHLQVLKGGLRRATEGWNHAVGSWQNRVFPQIEKAKSLGGKLSNIPELSTLDSQPREIALAPADEDNEVIVGAHGRAPLPTADQNDG